jgi:hypothetical protein
MQGLILSTAPIFAWGIVFSIAVAIFICWYFVTRPGVASGYDYDKTRCIGEILKDGKTQVLEGIDNPSKFKAFLIDLEFIHPGLGRRVLYVPPHDDCNAYTVKLMEGKYQYHSEL